MRFAHLGDPHKKRQEKDKTDHKISKTPLNHYISLNN